MEKTIFFSATTDNMNTADYCALREREGREYTAGERYCWQQVMSEKTDWSVWFSEMI